MYDCYFLAGRVGASVDLDSLDRRLGAVESRLPRMKKRNRMDRRELATELTDEVTSLNAGKIDEELGGLLPPEELAGLHTRMRAVLTRIAEILLTPE